MKLLPHTIPDNFSLSESTKAWLEREYPQLDEQRTVDAFVEWATNQRDNNKRSPTYGEPLTCLSWQMKFRNVVRIQMVNKWSTIAIPKQGKEIDIRWQEALANAKAIGCPIERRSIDSVESFKTRVKNWEITSVKTTRVIDFDALKKMAKS